MDNLPFHSLADFKSTAGEIWVKESLGPGLLSELPFFQSANIDYGRRRFRPLLDVGRKLQLREYYPQDKNLIRIAVRSTLRRKSQRTKRGSLSRLPELPIDIILEVASHLHPLELWNLFIASCTLQDALSSPTSSGMWRRAWQDAKMPPCPPNLTHHRWADLLFGEPICDRCKKYAAQPDWALHRRYCNACLKKSLMTREELPSECIATLLPMTYRRASWELNSDIGASGTASGRWRRADVNILHYKLERFRRQDKSLNGSAHPGGKSEPTLEDFMEGYIKRCRELAEHNLMCKSWLEAQYSLFTNTIEKTRTRILKFFFRRRNDLVLIRDTVYKWHRNGEIPRFSKRVLIKVLSRIEEIVERRKAEDHKLLQEFFKSLLRCKISLKLDVKPQFDWATPTWEEVHTWDPITQTLEDHAKYGQVTIGLSGNDELRKRCLGWAGKRKEFFMSRLPYRGESSQSREHRIHHSPTSVFTCFACKSSKRPSFRTFALCLIGWDELKYHINCVFAFRRGRRGIVWSYRGSDVVESILKLLDFPPETTIEHLDAVDARFVCGNCSGLCWNGNGSRMDGVDTVQALTWRELVGHAEEFDEDDSSHSVLRLHLLTQQAEAYAKNREMSPSTALAQGPVWACNHCANYFCHSQGDVRLHLESSHSIPEPVLYEDMVYYPREERAYRRAESFPRPDTDGNLYRCASCVPESEIYNLSQLRSHWETIHQQQGSIAEITFGQHYEVFPVISKSYEEVIV